MAGNAQPDLAAVDIHDVLSNERRRMVLSILHEEDTRSTTARDLSERIAEMETGQSPPPRNIRQSAYVSLHQTHLPKLDELEVLAADLVPAGQHARGSVTGPPPVQRPRGPTVELVPVAGQHQRRQEDVGQDRDVEARAEREEEHDQEEVAQRLQALGDETRD